MSSDQIKYLSHHLIDTEKWNNCIDAAENSRIYAYSWYLDHMCEHWDGLILNDYEMVMPLPWKKKYFIHYLYHPFLTAQLGVFGKDLSAQVIRDFLAAVPLKFRYWDFSLNTSNTFQLKSYYLYERSNFILDLSKTYEELKRNYRENIRRNIRKANQSGCYSSKDVTVKQVVALAKGQNNNTSDRNFNRFQNLYEFLYKKGQANCYGVYSADKELVASAAFIFSNNRAYYILVGNHPKGRTLGASPALVDAFIQDQANNSLILDFEGSDIRSLANFYSGFGAVEEKYAAIRLNRLPWWIKWIKSN